MKFVKITRSPYINMQPTMKDPKLEVKHHSGQFLVLLAWTEWDSEKAKYVDYLKLNGKLKRLEANCK